MKKNVKMVLAVVAFGLSFGGFASAGNTAWAGKVSPVTTQGNTAWAG